MKSVYVNLNGIFEMESDKETKQEVLQDIQENVHEDSVVGIEVVITTASGKRIIKRLDDWNTEIDRNVFDEDGVEL